MRALSLVTLGCLAILSGLAGCAAHKASLKQSVQVPGKRPAVRSLIVSPWAGELGALVGEELRARGFEVLDPGLRRQADAQLLLEVHPGPDDKPQSVTARLLAVPGQELIVELTWTNAAAGLPGSAADAAVRKDQAAAAKEIAAALAARLR